MCGRYVFNPGEDFYERFQAENRLASLPRSFNVVPGSQMPVITRNSPNRVELLRWGLVPFWATDTKIGNKMINARAESVASKPAFRRAFAESRCLVPANGFYEWQRGSKSKRPFYFEREDGEMLSMAGIYDVWHDGEGKELKSYAIITRDAVGGVSVVHERMPVLLTEKQESVWLDKESKREELVSLLESGEVALEFYPVSKAVNNPAIDNPRLISAEGNEGA